MEVLLLQFNKKGWFILIIPLYTNTFEDGKLINRFIIWLSRYVELLILVQV